MIIGILVNSDRNCAAVAGLGREAVAAGHTVIIFAMDSGTRLLEQQSFTSLAGVENITISYCEHSALELGVDTAVVPAAIQSGSQYNNAAMNHQADRVVVL